MRARVLVVEDNPILARPLARFLLQSGYDVHHVDTCAAARGAQGPFDIGVFDVQLPDGSGIDLCAELLGNGLIGCAVFYTGSLDSAVLQRAAAIAQVVRKTESVDILRQAICAALNEAAENGPDGCCTARNCS
jgi:DNA-binding response OmpR family regulator